MREPALRPRTPWWVYLLAASYLVAFSFQTYQMFMGYASDPSAGAAMSDAPAGGALVERVRPGTPMEQAGVRAGDVIVALDGQRLRTDHDFGDTHWNFQPGKPFVLTVIRAGQQLQFTMTFPNRRVWETLDHAQWLGYAMNVALGLAYLSAGLLVLFARPRDWGVLAGAVLLLGQPLLLGVVSNGYAVLLRQLPVLLQVPIFSLPVIGGGFWLLLFAALFPRPVFRSGWTLLALAAPGLLAIPNNIVRQYHRIYMPGNEVFPGPAWHYQAGIAVELAYFVAGFVVLSVGYRRLHGPERQLAGKVLLSALISYGSPILLLISFALELPPAITRLLWSPTADFVMLFLQSIFPLAFAHAALSAEQRPAESIAGSA
jgi:hypothetical protein